MERLCHNCDTKPVFAAKTDSIDELALLILPKLLKTKNGLKDPAYRLTRSFSRLYAILRTFPLELCHLEFVSYLSTQSGRFARTR